MLDRRPLALQLRDSIWDTIQSQQLRSGDRLPSEQELVKRFQVSRSTVREALKILEEQRLILCRHGVGRFVAPGPSGVLSEGITRLQSVTEMAAGLAIPLSTRVLSLEERLSDGSISARLGLDVGVSLVVLERVWLADGVPVIYSLDTLPRSLVLGQAAAGDFSGSLLATMESSWNAQIMYARTVIRAVHLAPSVSERIGVPDGIPWILLEQVNYGADDRPVLYSKDYHRGDRFYFHVLRSRR
ncbi:MAG: GntR family transcriptional regulator [Chloroflexi bacterium]|nr:GntR family transcriptional regulator [Chloroflexota bacterium]